MKLDIQNKKKIIPFVLAVLGITGVILYFDLIRHTFEDKNHFECSGTIEVTEIDVSTKIAGKVIALAKEEGEPVKTGEILAKLSYSELDAQRLSVIASLTNAKKNLDRVKQLFHSGSISKRDYDSAETVFRIAQANFDAVNASISNAMIASPIDGIVLERNLEIGEMAMPGTPIVTVADLSSPWMKIYLPEPMLGRIIIGQAARIYIDSHPKKPFKGKIVSISKKAEFTPKTIQTKDERVKLMYAVKIILENPDQILKPGMPADAVIKLREIK